MGESVGGSVGGRGVKNGSHFLFICCVYVCGSVGGRGVKNGSHFLFICCVYVCVPSNYLCVFVFSSLKSQGQRNSLL